MSEITSNKRIAKNTLYLYLQMFLTMGVSLYTSRIVLNTLGVEDFGIYNVVAGVIVLFTFINGALAIASQRYISFAIGKGDSTEIRQVFSMSITSHVAIALTVFFIAETIGRFLLWKLNFPVDRYDAIEWLYQLSVLTCIVSIIRIPYNAMIIANEKMLFYAWVSIIEVIFKLIIVFILIITTEDKLIVYALLLLSVTIITNFIYHYYCRRNFPESKYLFFFDKELFKEFFSFSGWSIAGSLANVGSQQGLTMILNVFCGVTVNAAVGICNQVMNAVGQFLTNFQTAFNPQLVKSYAVGDKEYFMNLIFKSSKFSYYLMFIISIPAVINCSFLLEVWLDTVPLYAAEFSQLMIVFLLFDAISGPLWISVQATGNIKKYQLLMAFLILLNLPLAFCVLSQGLSPVYVFVVRVLINIVTLLVRVVYLRSLIKLPARKFIVQVLLPIFFVTLLVLPLPLYMKYILEDGWINLISNSFASIILSFVIIYLIGLTQSEKALVNNLVKSKIRKLA